MKIIFILIGLMMPLSLLPAQADAPQPTAFEKALYDKCRYKVLKDLNDDDFVSYCTTMNFGGDTLLKFHDEILDRQTELSDLMKRGFPPDNPQVTALNDALTKLRGQLAAKVFEARKGLEVEARVAEATLEALGQYQK
jgi:hypothetical protein